jgi:hypothetical protein
MSDTRNVILILGMHRSGTSAVTGVLAKLGAVAPRDPVPAAQFNRRGFWEPLSVVGFNDRLLSALGSRWQDWRRVDPLSLTASVMQTYKQQARAAFCESFGSEKLVALKDPRICRLVPFWIDVLTELGIQPRVVIPVRSPLEVALSLAERDGMPLTLALLLWLRHVLEAEYETRKLPRSIFSWNEFLTDWRQTSQKISGDIGISWPAISKRSSDEIDAFLSGDLKHQTVTDAELSRHPDVHKWILKSYDALLDLAQNQSSSGAFSALDDVRTEFDTSCALFEGAVAEYLGQIGCLKDQIEQARADTAKAKAETEKAEDEKVRANADTAKARAEAEKAEAKTLKATVETAKAKADTELARSELERNQAKLLTATRERELILTSTTWLMTKPLRGFGALVPYPARVWLRRILRLVWWCMTPWALSPRLQYLRSRHTPQS